MKFLPTKSFLKFFLLLILGPLLAGCSLLSNVKLGGNQKITLTYWGLYESASTINSVVADYKKTHPNVDVIYVKKPLEQYRETLQSQIKSGTGPDIFEFHNTWVPMIQDVLSPVPSNVVSGNDFKNNFYPTTILDLRNSNKQFVGIPLEIDGLGLYWNKDIFKAAGILNPPATWQDLSQDAAKLTVKDTSGNIITSGAALGTSTNIDHFSDVLGLMIFQNGGDPKQPTDKYSADALEYYTNFAKGDNRVWDESMPQSTVAFVGGHLAMYFGPSWEIAEIKTQNPLLNFQIAPVPQLAGGKVSWASYWVEGVSTTSPNKQAAWDFIKFLQQDSTLTKLYAGEAKTPSRFIGEPYSKVALASQLKDDPYAGAYIQDAPYMKSFPMASRTSDNGLNDQIIKIYQDVTTVTLHGTPAQSALQTAAPKIADVFSKFTAAPPK